MAYHFSNHSFSPPNLQNETGLFNAEGHYEGWKYKLIDYWSSNDTLFWLLSELYKLQVHNPATLKLEQFVNTRGCDLKRFSEEDFCKIFPQYGEILYHQLQLKLGSMMKKAWHKKLVSHQLHASPGPSSSADHLRMSYFNPPVHPTLPHHIPPDTYAPKNWPSDRRIYNFWSYKRVLEWSPSDTLDFIIHELFQLNINPASVNLDNFRQVYGRDLVRMTLDDFNLMLPECGELLYRHLQPKMRLNLESELPWRRTHESQVISNQISSQPFSFAHRQELPYAHPSCFRWKPERFFPGISADNDSVLNLSTEHTSTSASDLSDTNVALQATLSASRSKQFTSFDLSPASSKSESPVSKSNFSILNLTKDSVKHTSTVVIKQEKDCNPPLKVPDPVKKLSQVVECSLSQHPPTRDSDSRDSCSVENTQDSVVSTADSLYTKGVESYVMDHGYNSETNDDQEEEPIYQEEESYKKEKRKPGRPRSFNKKDKAKGKVGRVWEFIRDLIMDPRYNPSVISWEDREKGLFRFRSGDQVAKLWGCKRSNPRMNFENFSRSIRQNYKKGYLLPVEKIRLVYQFGPRSTGWRPGDPPTRPVTLPPATPVPVTLPAAAAVTVTAQ